MSYDDDADDDMELNTDWIQTAQTLCSSNEYSPIPSIRMVLLKSSDTNTYRHEVVIVDRADFPSFLIPRENHIIRDIALFAFDIQKHQLLSGRYAYESMGSIDNVRERLVGLSAFPCFFDLFEIVVILDELKKPVSVLRGSGRAKTRKTVQFHHSCTRRNHDFK